MSNVAARRTYPTRPPVMEASRACSCRNRRRLSSSSSPGCQPSTRWPWPIPTSSLSRAAPAATILSGAPCACSAAAAAAALRAASCRSRASSRSLRSCRSSRSSRSSRSIAPSAGHACTSRSTCAAILVLQEDLRADPRKLRRAVLAGVIENAIRTKRSLLRISVLIFSFGRVNFLLRCRYVAEFHPRAFLVPGTPRSALARPQCRSSVWSFLELRSSIPVLPNSR